MNPSSVMGATKRVAEMLLSQAAPQHGPTRFVAVRFGNVLGSRGQRGPDLPASRSRTGGP